MINKVFLHETQSVAILNHCHSEQPPQQLEEEKDARLEPGREPGVLVPRPHTSGFQTVRQ